MSACQRNGAQVLHRFTRDNWVRGLHFLAFLGNKTENPKIPMSCAFQGILDTGSGLIHELDITLAFGAAKLLQFVLPKSSSATSCMILFQLVIR